MVEEAPYQMPAERIPDMIQEARRGEQLAFLLHQESREVVSRQEMEEETVRRQEVPSEEEGMAFPGVAEAMEIDRFRVLAACRMVEEGMAGQGGLRMIVSTITRRRDGVE